jgi:hypothetical protein
MKCYISKDEYDKFHLMVNELIQQYRILNHEALKYGLNSIDEYKKIPFMIYIDKNYHTFTTFSKNIVNNIYLRFQEEALPIMDYIK